MASARCRQEGLSHAGARRLASLFPEAAVYTHCRDEANREPVYVEAPLSSGRHFPIRSFVASVVLVAVAVASVYLSYELVVKPRQALLDQIRITLPPQPPPRIKSAQPALAPNHSGRRAETTV